MQECPELAEFFSEVQWGFSAERKVEGYARMGFEIEAEQIIGAAHPLEEKSAPNVTPKNVSASFCLAATPDNTSDRPLSKGP